ncbi:MAG: CoB--CoM heterodisulfide reductase iron-sulfur subunit A family protein, partial [Desulfurococcaceae archaeon]|nr:CoB--CoM heterodisulfide reductase iron-sulfur subunit A family protein [Desulfurococcaceae archaeon]
LIVKAIREHKLDGVVVAACTPSLHYETFAKAVERAGLNRYMLEMVSIRELDSWVHIDKNLATEKATRLIAAAVAKLTGNKAYEPIRVKVTKKALVIGGGIAGITASLSLAKMGIPVILVEKTPSIGGKMAMLHETFPTLDCAQCILTPLMAEVARHPLVKIYTLTEVESVEGYVGNFKVKLRVKPRGVRVGECRLCGFCERVCPVEVPSEFNRGLSKRKAVYIPFAQAIPAAYTVDFEHCTKCGRCVKVCPTKAIDLDQREEVVEETVGAVIVATGYDLYTGEKLPEYMYGAENDVVDSLQFERILDVQGPTRGEIKRPSDNRPVKRVVFIQCAGSRDINHLPYCSKICCMYTAKHALLFMERVPGGEAYVFYIDVRAGGKGFEEFIKRAQEHGAVYIKGRVSRVYRDRETGDIIVEGYDLLDNREVVIRADLVVLALGVVSALDRKLAESLKIPVDQYMFVSEIHPKLRPVETPVSGVLVAGTAQGPKDIPESIAQAASAAAKAAELLLAGHIEKEPLVAEVNRDKCNGCRVCITVCPYGAVEITDGKARVNEALCEGCGACAASCPVGAIQLRNYSEEQALEVVKAVLKVK